jgi:hypothetical protein
VDLVDRVTRPGGVGERVHGQQQDGASRRRHSCRKRSPLK